MQNNYDLQKFLVFSLARIRTAFSPLPQPTGGDLLRKPMNTPLDGVAEIP